MTDEVLIRAVPHRGAIENGQWRVLTSTARDEISRVRQDPRQLAQARTRRERQQGLVSKLARGTLFVNGVIDGHPAKILTWADATGEVHTCALVAVDEPGTTHPAGKASAPTARTRLIRIIRDTQGHVSYAYEVFEATELPGLTITFGSALLAAVASLMTRIGTQTRSAVTAAVELIEIATTANQVARAAREAPLIVAGVPARLIAGGRVLARVGAGLAIVGALIGIADVMFRKLLSRMTVSIDLTNFTDDDFEWTISEIDNTSVWLNPPEDHHPGQWAELPGVDRMAEPLPGVDGAYDRVASVEIGIANSSSEISANTSRLCLSIRRKGSNVPPFVFMFTMPPGSPNRMAIETGTAHASFFDAHSKGMQETLSLKRDVVVDGLPVSLEATTDRNTGETSYAELRGRNYTVSLMIGARRYRILTKEGGMALAPSDDGTQVVQRPVDLSATSQEWMLMARPGAGHEIIHRATRKALTVSHVQGGTRLTLEDRRATDTGQMVINPRQPLHALEWVAQAFLIRDLYGDTTPIVSMSAPLVLDVERASQEAGAPVILWGLHNGPNQWFRFQEVD